MVSFRPYHRREKAARLSGALLATALLLAACQSSNLAKPPAGEQAPPEPPLVDVDEFAGIDFGRTPTLGEAPVRIGLLLPLSGRHAAVGEALRNAAQMAIYDVGGERVALTIHDTQGTPAGAEAAAREALLGGARLLLGPLFSTSVQAVAPLARSASVRVIAYSNDRSVAGEGIFVMGLPPRPQFLRVVDFASRQGLQRMAVLVPDSPYGEAVLNAAREGAYLNGVELVRSMTYDPNAVDIAAEVRTLVQYEDRHDEVLKARAKLEGKEDEESKAKLAELEAVDTLEPPDFEAVILAEAGERLRAIAPLFPYYDADPETVRLLGPALWDDPALLSEPNLKGAWFAALQPDEWASFRQRYQSYYGEVPPRIAPLAYDSTALGLILALQAIQQNQLPEFPIAHLTQPNGFAGIDGIFRFLPNGETERTLAVMELGPDGFTVLEPAPRSFQPAVF